MKDNLIITESKPKKRCLTEKETAHYLGVSCSVLRHARMDGDRKDKFKSPPFIKLGRAVRYLKDDLDRWLETLRKGHECHE